jgi:hypothetical protein
MALINIDWLKIRTTGEYVRLIQYVTDGGFRFLVAHEDGGMSLACPGDLLRVDDPLTVIDREFGEDMDPQWYPSILEREREVRASRRSHTPPARRPQAPYATPGLDALLSTASRISAFDEFEGDPS